jgi:nicotinate-nucleotide pyrophosphorylase (carboxylating)
VALDLRALDQLIDIALQEDVGEGDHSSLSCIPPDTISKARLLVKQDGVLCGLEAAKAVFNKVDPQLHIQVIISEGSPIHAGDIAFYAEGSALSILTAERLVLNLMQRMSGIATKTRQFVDAVAGIGTQIIDTRKTTPGIRFLEKYAVTVGGGANHRMGLYDMIMLKDNHIDYCGGIGKAIEAANTYLTRNKLDLKIEVETRNLDEVRQVLGAGSVHRIMLDNFSPALLKEAVQLIGGKYETEASGGIHIDNVRDYALTGVDFISVGALTHSAIALDLSLKAEIAR